MKAFLLLLVQGGTGDQMKMQVGKILVSPAVDDQPVAGVLKVEVMYQFLEAKKQVSKEAAITGGVKRVQAGDWCGTMSSMERVWTVRSGTS